MTTLAKLLCCGGRSRKLRSKEAEDINLSSDKRADEQLHSDDQKPKRRAFSLGRRKKNKGVSRDTSRPPAEPESVKQEKDAVWLTSVSDADSVLDDTRPSERSRDRDATFSGHQSERSSSKGRTRYDKRSELPSITRSVGGREFTYKIKNLVETVRSTKSQEFVLHKWSNTSEEFEAKRHFEPRKGILSEDNGFHSATDYDEDAERMPPIARPDDVIDAIINAGKASRDGTLSSKSSDDVFRSDSRGGHITNDRLVSVDVAAASVDTNVNEISRNNDNLAINIQLESNVSTRSAPSLVNSEPPISDPTDSVASLPARHDPLQVNEITTESSTTLVNSAPPPTFVVSSEKVNHSSEGDGETLEVNDAASKTGKTLPAPPPSAAVSTDSVDSESPDKTLVVNEATSLIDSGFDSTPPPILVDSESGNNSPENQDETLEVKENTYKIAADLVDSTAPPTVGMDTKSDETLEVNEIAAESQADTLEENEISPESQETIEVNEITPAAQDDTLEVNEISPESQDQTINVNEITPESQDDTLEMNEITPENQGETIQVNEISPESQDATLDVNEIIPENQDDTLEINEITSETVADLVSTSPPSAAVSINDETSPLENQDETLEVDAITLKIAAEPVDFTEPLTADINKENEVCSTLGKDIVVDEEETCPVTNVDARSEPHEQIGHSQDVDATQYEEAASAIVSTAVEKAVNKIEKKDLDDQSKELVTQAIDAATAELLEEQGGHELSAEEEVELDEEADKLVKLVIHNAVIDLENGNTREMNIDTNNAVQDENSILETEEDAKLEAVTDGNVQVKNPELENDSIALEENVSMINQEPKDIQEPKESDNEHLQPDVEQSETDFENPKADVSDITVEQLESTIEELETTVKQPESDMLTEAEGVLDTVESSEQNDQISINITLDNVSNNPEKQEESQRKEDIVKETSNSDDDLDISQIEQLNPKISTESPKDTDEVAVLSEPSDTNVNFEDQPRNAEMIQGEDKENDNNYKPRAALPSKLPKTPANFRRSRKDLRKGSKIPIPKF